MTRRQRPVTVPAIQFFLRYPGRNGIRVIDVAGERNKPVYMSDEEFEEKISRYTLEDYLHSEEPYYDLIEVSRGQVGLYDQHANVLMDAVRNATTDPQEIMYVADKVDVNRWVFIQGTREANSILSFISKVETDADTADKVSVLPLMCGSGKSTAITLETGQKVKCFLNVKTSSTKNTMLLWMPVK